jgi:2-keto-3-deoxy-L-rhamnonate aldolase RhmA
VKVNLKDGKKHVGTMICELYSPNIARMLKVCGFDYFIIDCEHGAFDYSQANAMIATANALELTVLVRIPKIDRECCLKYLEAGADGLLVPMVNTREEAEKIVELTRYMPLGKRGISTKRAHNSYYCPDIRSYIQEANQRITILVQAETRQALANTDAIASVEGIDGVVIGPNDLSCDMGHLGDYSTPEFRQGLEDVLAAAQKRGKIAGYITSKTEEAKVLFQQGMDLICWNSELGMILNAARDSVADVKKTL